MSTSGISSGSSARTCKVWNLDKMPAAVRRRVTLLGEHNQAVLGERLGLNDDDLAEHRMVY